MSVSALEVVSVVNAIREGVILVDDLKRLAEQDAITSEQAEMIIDRNIEEIRGLRDND